jgi:hypothetical protein
MCSAHRPKGHHGAATRGSRQAETRSRPPRTRTAAEKAKKKVADSARNARNKGVAAEEKEAQERALTVAVEEKKEAEMAKMAAVVALVAKMGEALVAQAAEYRETDCRQTDMQTHRHTDRQTDRQTDRRRWRQPSSSWRRRSRRTSGGTKLPVFGATAGRELSVCPSVCLSVRPPFCQTV